MNQEYFIFALEFSLIVSALIFVAIYSIVTIAHLLFVLYKEFTSLMRVLHGLARSYAHQVVDTNHTVVKTH